MSTPEVEATAPRQERQERGERPERSDRQQGRNRGRGERGERPPREPAAAASAEISAEAEAIVQNVEIPHEPIVVAAQNVVETAAPAFVPHEALAPVAVSQANQAELPFVASEPAPAPVKAPEPIAAAPAPAPIPQPAPASKPVDLEAAGLVMIETSSDKVAAAPIIEQAPAVPRGPRPKPAWAQKSPASIEPMQQVETRD